MNQLCTRVLRDLTLAIARSENVTGDRPGVHDRHFCVAEYTASAPQASTSTGVPPREVTVSTMVSAPYLLAIWHSVCASDWAPVEVSACTKATTATPGLAFSASSSFCGSTGLPHSSSTTMAVPPQRSTFSIMRPPNTPLRHTMTLSPGSTRFTKHASMPTEPGPDIGKVRALFVWKA